MVSLSIPSSDRTVRVRAINAVTNMSVATAGFMQPILPGFDVLNLTSVTFVLDHPTLERRVLFDCGARKDFENYSPTIKSRLNLNVKGLTVEKDVNDILEESGIALSSIESMIWSHWHWDHHGAPEKYPSSVDIVVGPGFKENFMPGYPTNPDAILLDANYAGREVRELSFHDSALTIGGFRVIDYFGDGSFYLLDSPGHAIGHMCGLARTTPTTFIFLGGDICHYSGMYRPTASLPLPDRVPSEQLDGFFPSPCPCSVFTTRHPLLPPGCERAKESPFFEVTSATQSAYLDRTQAMNSIKAMQAFDASPDVLVCIAHDPTLLQVLPFLNDDPQKDLNDWQQQAYKEKARWGWLNELPRGGQPGRAMLIEGVWRHGELVEDFTKLATTT